MPIDRTMIGTDRVIRWGCMMSDKLEEFSRRLGEVAAVKAEAQRLKDELEADMLDYAREHGAFEIGQTRYYVGRETKHERVVKPATVLAGLLDATGGDLDAIGECLASAAWKQSSVRGTLTKAIGDEAGLATWAQWWTTEVEDVLKLKAVSKDYV